MSAVSDAIDAYLTGVYYNPGHPGSYSGADKLYRTAKSEGHNEVTLDVIREWLAAQDVHTLHRSLRRKFPRNRVVVSGIGAQYDSDLADMTNLAQYNNGYKYFMATIDVFSRYLWVVPMKGKTSSDAVAALKQMFETAPVPRLFRTDKGGEYCNRRVSQYMNGIGSHHFVTQNDPKSNYAERVLKTIKGRITRHFTHTQSYKYVDVLDDIVRAYNNTYHSSIKMTPTMVDKDNEIDLWRHLYPPLDGTRSSKSSRTGHKHAKVKPFALAVGDHVRLSHIKSKFDREYDQKWTGELFKISQRFRREGLNIYRVDDYNDSPVTGTFYVEELQKVVISPDKVWKIAKIIKSRKRRGRAREVLVRWLHWPPNHDSWVQASEVKKYQ